MIGETIHEEKMVNAFWVWSMWIMIAGFIAMAVFIPDQPAIARWSLVGSAVILLLVLPDIRAVYGTDGIRLTFGIGGIWKKKITRDEVTYISIVEFNPMKHFGGWGIKYGRGEFRGVLMWSMITKEPRGILVETVNGKKYLIGDREPDTTLTLLGSVYPVDPGMSETVSDKFS